MSRPETLTYLQMLSPGDLVPAPGPENTLIDLVSLATTDPRVRR